RDLQAREADLLVQGLLRPDQPAAEVHGERHRNALATDTDRVLRRQVHRYQRRSEASSVVPSTDRTLPTAPKQPQREARVHTEMALGHTDEQPVAAIAMIEQQR